MTRIWPAGGMPTPKQLPQLARRIGLPKDGTLYYLTLEGSKLVDNIKATRLPTDVSESLFVRSPFDGMVVRELDDKCWELTAWRNGWEFYEFYDNEFVWGGWPDRSGVLAPPPPGSKELDNFLSLMFVILTPSLSERTVESVPSGRWSKSKGGKKRKHVDPVNVIDLRRAAKKDQADVAEAERMYRHQWIVRGHWRQQACGPGRSERRSIYIAPHVKGPEGAEMIQREKVYRW